MIEKQEKEAKEKPEKKVNEEDEGSCMYDLFFVKKDKGSKSR